MLATTLYLTNQLYLLHLRRIGLRLYRHHHRHLLRTSPCLSHRLAKMGKINKCNDKIQLI